MAVNPFVTTDFLANAIAQETEQFKDKVVFNKYLELLLTGSIDVLAVIKDLMQLRSIDTAVGEQLDVIGRIVGQDRVLYGADTIKYFGFDGATLAGTFGTSYNSRVGGYWYSFGKPTGGNITLDDPQYKLFIKAKIKKNTTDASAESVMDFLTFVFGVRCTLLESSAAKAKIRINRKLSDFERSLVEFQAVDGSYFVPRPLGVGLEVEEPLTDGSLGFLGTPDALGMISLYSMDAAGGIFGSIYTAE